MGGAGLTPSAAAGSTYLYRGLGLTQSSVIGLTPPTPTYGLTPLDYIKCTSTSTRTAFSVFGSRCDALTLTIHNATLIMCGVVCLARVVGCSHTHSSAAHASGCPHFFCREEEMACCVRRVAPRGPTDCSAFAMYLAAYNANAPCSAATSQVETIALSSAADPTDRQSIGGVCTRAAP